MSIYTPPRPTEPNPFLERLVRDLTRAEDILAFPLMGTETDTGTDGGGGGGGTVTSVAGGVGITNSPEPIVGAGTVDLDINSLATEASPAAGDLVALVDVSVGTAPAAQRKATLASLLTAIGAQPLDADLTALAALAGTGLVARTGAGTAATRTLQAPAAGLTIGNPGGVAGDPSFALANDLAALEALAGTGFAVRTAADAWAQRSIAGSASVQVTNGDGVAGNPTLAVLAAGVDHGGLGGLGDDDHSIYALLAGRAGGQTQHGGTAASEVLTLRGTAHATRGTVDLDDLVRLFPSFPEPATGAAPRLVDFNPTLAAFNNAVVSFYGVSIRPNYAFSGPLNMAQSIFHFGGVQEDDGGAGSNAGILRVIDVDATFLSEDANQLPPGVTRLFDDRTVTQASADTAGTIGAISTHYGLNFVPTLETIGGLASASLWVSNAAGLRTQPVLRTAAAGQSVLVSTLRGVWVAGVGASGAGAESATTYCGVDIDSVAVGTTNLSLRSPGTAMQMRHAGPAAFGINGAPNTTIDDAGSLATRRADVAIANAANNDLNVGTTAYVRLTGGGASAALNSITGGADGRILVLINGTGANLTVNNNGGGTAVNQILTRTGGAVTVAALDALWLIYDTNASRWRQVVAV